MSLLLPADRYQFSIVPADISDSSIVSTTVDSAYYNGSALTPAVHFSIGGTECNYVEGEDYSLTYANNVLGADATSANPPTVTINILNHTHLVAHDADGNEVDSITVPFTIGYTPVALANATWSVGSQVSLDASSTVGALGEPDLSATYVSTDAAQTVRTVPADAYTVETGTWDGSTFTVKTNGWKAGDQVWYRVSANGKNLAFTGQTVVGPSTVVAAATANSFTDLGKSGNSMVATFSQTAYTYTGAQIEPNLAIVDGAKIKTLTRGIDYTLSYGANLNAGTGAGTVTVKGKGAYTGTCTLGFDIAPASLSDCTTTVADQVYTGAQLKPAADKVTVSLGGAALQAADWALDASGYGSNTVAGDAGGSLTITAGTSGNLTGSLNVTFPIERRALSASDFAATQSAAKTYTGLPITLSAGDLQVTDTVNARTLAYGTDYVVNYAGDHTSAGKATIWISGQGNYASSMSATFTIGAVDLATAMVLPDPASYTYTGAAVKAAAAVKLGGQTLTERYTAVTGEVCGDYGLNYTNNVNAGDASSSNPPTVTAAGRGNYTGTSSAAFAIVPATMSVGNTTVTLAESSFVYTGAEIKPVPIVKMGDVTLPATDYDVSYTANVAVGTATVTVTGKAPNFDAKASTPVSTTFQITRASLADCTVAAVPDQYYAFGSAVAPSLDIKNAAGTALVEGTDYKVTITNNTSVGTASVAITGIGAYEGSTASTTFKIVKVPISTDDVSASPTTFAYDGNAHAPAVTVTVEGHTLAEGTDYQLNYLGDRTSVGTQVIEIQALAPYLTSSATVSYSIVKSSWSRLYGQTALDTMRSIVGKGWPTSSSGSTCPTVVIATMGGYWDALTASALAGLNDCPVLLTNGSSLSDQTRAEIKRLGATKVYIAGGTAAVSQKVQDQLTSELGVKVTRLAGDNASGTALKIYEQGKGSWSKTAVIATAATFQDALSVSPYAYAKASPVFLANVGTSNGSMKLADDVVSALKQGGFTNAIITGGTAAISSSVEQQLTSAGIGTGHVTRLWGNTAYETSSAIASYCVDNGMSADYLGVATGEDYYDALSGAALCGRNNAALVLVSDHNTSAIDSFIRGNRASITAGYVFGGSAAVSDAVYAKCVAATG